MNSHRPAWSCCEHPRVSIELLRTPTGQHGAAVNSRGPAQSSGWSGGTPQPHCSPPHPSSPRGLQPPRSRQPPLLLLRDLAPSPWLPADSRRLFQLQKALDPHQPQLLHDPLSKHCQGLPSSLARFTEQPEKAWDSAAVPLTKLPGQDPSSRRCCRRGCPRPWGYTHASTPANEGGLGWVVGHPCVN